MLWKPKFMKVVFSLFLCSYDFYELLFFLDLLKIKLSFYLLQKLPLQVTAWRFVSDPGRCNLFSSSLPFPSQLASSLSEGVKTDVCKGINQGRAGMHCIRRSGHRALGCPAWYESLPALIHSWPLSPTLSSSSFQGHHLTFSSSNDR